jgi:cytochrome c-type protein NapC
VFKRVWNWLQTPSRKYGCGGIFIVGGVAGIIFWGGFNTAMEATNTLDFCLTCHEMNDNVGAEYKQSVHYANRTGVRATCSDCHVPDPWVHKVVRKIKASNELWHWALGTVDTPEKFEDKRLTLAKHVWADMKKTDSRECRNCHSWEAMLSDMQKQRAQKRHEAAKAEGLTCIDCHKGIAHRAVHKLLEEGDDPYDNKPDSRRLIPKAEEAKIEAEKAAKMKAAEEAAAKAAAEAAKNAAASAPAGAAAGGGDTGGDWTGVPSKDVVLLYPGQASLEWVLNGPDHGGARAVRRAGDRCQECHGKEQADMGNKIVTGEKAEPTPIPGKRGSIKMAVQAKHDGTDLVLRFQWPDTGHTPAPFADGGKMDPKNQVKLAVMFDDGKVEMAEQVGCWVTCHHDSRYMPDAPKADVLAANKEVAARIDVTDGVTKYTKGSRTKLEYKGKGGKPRGAWDQLIGKDELAEKHASGAFMDILRFNSGSAAEAGYILADRKLTPSDKVMATGTLADGTWTVVVRRPLAAIQPGGVAFETGKTYTVGFAIHDDFTAARFHHVSLEYRMALDDEKAEINVVKK